VALPASERWRHARMKRELHRKDTRCHSYSEKIQLCRESSGTLALERNHPWRVSRQSGIDRTQIARWINGRSRANEKSIVRIEKAIAAIAPSAALSVFIGSEPNESHENVELDKFRGYVAVFRRLMELQDRTPHRWRYFQTEWLWLYTRGMVEGVAPAEVKSRRLAELEVKGEDAGEEAALIRESTEKEIAHFMKPELYGGPADGRYVYLRVPVSDEIVVDAPSAEGEMMRAGYRRASGTVGDITPLQVSSASATSYESQVEEALRGKKTAKYIYDANVRI
jgi:hypothetical protein